MFKQARVSIRSKIIIGYLLILCCLGASILILNGRIAEVQGELDYIVGHDWEVNNSVNQIEKNMLDMETGVRGYIASDEPRYLEPYWSAKARWEQDYNKLYELTDNQNQRNNLKAIKSNIELWIVNAGENFIALKRENKDQELLSNMKNDIGKSYTDQLRSQLDSFRSMEKQATNDRVSELNRKNEILKGQLYLFLFIITLVSMGVAVIVSGGIVRNIRQVTKTIGDIASSDGNMDTRRIQLNTTDEMRELGIATNRLLDTYEMYNWLQSSNLEIANLHQGKTNIHELSDSFIGKLVPILNAMYGVFYLRSDQGGTPRMLKAASYADGSADIGVASFDLGEGLVGQSAKDNRVFLINEIPQDYVKVKSGLGDTLPKTVIIVPVEFQDKAVGVIEIASLEAFTPIQLHFLQQLRTSFGLIIDNVRSRMEVERLFHESRTMTEELQQQAEELQTQTEELQSQSEELMAQQDELRDSNESLRQSEERLQRQQEELEQSNQQLAKNSLLLVERMRYAEEINSRIEQQNIALEKQAEELAAISKYKSEFLANMSHELRTPLNSMLILSQLLAENKDGNLHDKQVEFATTIHSSGNDLLRLIDEILDLTKVEAGKIELEIDHISLVELKDVLWRNFQPIAAKKGLSFMVDVEDDVPLSMYTDGHRLQQILKNLLSNAIKFTGSGRVSLHVYRTTRDAREHEAAADSIAFSVKDTGIGIPENKQSLIFEAFRQADGTTNRRFGGTGLGLTISRELASMLGGVIELDSEDGKGSTFTLYLPVSHGDHILAPNEVAVTAYSTDTQQTEVFIPKLDTTDPVLLRQSDVPDDRERLEPGDKVLLIIEDDIYFAKIILEIAQSRGFKGLVALQGDKGLALAHAYKPDAIMLDIQLPVIDGWAILDNLKKNPDTRHIPVHVISVEDDPQQGLTMGAMAYLRKPADKQSIENAFGRIEELLNRTMKRLLIVEDDIPLRESLVELIGHDDVIITAVSTGEETLRELSMNHFDCMVMDLGLSDMTGFELLDRIRTNERLRTVPIIIYTGQDLDTKEEMELKKYAESIIIKNVKSQERLYDETALFLHRVEADLPEDRRTMLRKLYSNENAFTGKHILLAEDDIRNVFALSNVLEHHHLKITYAENGREALEILEERSDFDLILMDIMMQEMDGYEAMKQIRRNPRLAKVPIIALTAKAMKEDREKCIAAGASDYISKPINMDRLFSLLKVWLYK